MKELVRFSWVGLVLVACGGSAPPAETPVAEAEPAESAPAPAKSAPAEAERAESPPKPDKVEPAEPVFTDGMSVAEAIKAVPQGMERANIDQETLSKPIQDYELYEPCKPGSARLTLKIAVWDGRAVGIDVTSAPKNDKLVGCVKDRIKGLKWQAKVKSLNTVDYQL
jgi:hypothetical protein